MKPRDPHIVEALHLVAQGFGGKRRFLGGIHVAGASSSHHNSAITRWFGHVPKQPHARNVKVSEFIGEVVSHKAYRFGLHAGNEHRLCAALLQRFRNAANLIRGFSFAIDNLGGVLAYPKSVKGSFFKESSASAGVVLPAATLSNIFSIASDSMHPSDQIGI